MKSIKTILSRYNPGQKKGYISREFQDFGWRLAQSLDDDQHKSLYIKLAKTVERKLLEQALTFIKDAGNVRSKARLFMWKLKQLRAL